MPIFLDIHSLGEYSRKEIESIERISAKLGVKVHTVLANNENKLLFCICESPDKEKVQKYHDLFDITQNSILPAEDGHFMFSFSTKLLKCDTVIPVEQSKPTNFLKRDKLLEMGERAVRVSHDLKNPLMIIKNSINLIELNLENKTNEPIKENIARIKKTLENATNQVNEVMNFVKTRSLKFTDNSVKSIIESALSSIKLKDNVRIDLPKNDTLIKCDPVLLENVFYNLLTNAVEATDIQEIATIKIRIFNSGNSAIIEIEDSGPEISSELIDKIFEPLFTTKSDGTGMGLASCKNIVEQHGGRITVRSNPTVFSIMLPNVSQ